MTEPISPSTLPNPPQPKNPLSPVLTLLMGGVLACALVLIGYAMGSKSNKGLMNGSGGSIEYAVQQVGPAVMNVDTELGKGGTDEILPSAGEGMGDEPRNGKGTGVVIDSARGLMLTNAHVVSDPESGKAAKKIS